MISPSLSTITPSRGMPDLPYLPPDSQDLIWAWPLLLALFLQHWGNCKLEGAGVIVSTTDFHPGTIWLLSRHLEMSSDIFGCHSLGSWCHWHRVDRSYGCHSTFYHSQERLHIIKNSPAKVSVMPRSRNAGADLCQTTVPAAGSF